MSYSDISKKVILIQGGVKKAKFGQFLVIMGFKDGTVPPQPPTILPSSVENQQPHLSIGMYEEHYPMVYRRCLAILGNAEDAEDAAHDVFARIQKRKAKGLFSVTYPKTYLSRMATNMGIDKKKERRDFITTYDIATTESLNGLKDNWEPSIMDNGYEQVEAEIIVQAILDEQDEITRKIYFYKYRDDMTLEQIAEVVGLRKSAVHKRIKKLEGVVKAKMGRADT